MSAGARVARIRAALEAAFEPEALSVEDESELHRGHAGARDGRGHFRVRIVSTAFAAARHSSVIAWSMARSAR